MTSVQQHEYLPLSNRDTSDNGTLVNALATANANSSSSSIPLQPSKWKTKGRSKA